MDLEEEYVRRELQRKHYFYFNELQKMAKELPGTYQQRLSYDLLSSLASVLLDGTMFEIANSLKEVQQLEERNLSNHRIKFVNEQKTNRQALQRKHREMKLQCQNKPHNIPYVTSQCDTELAAFDKQCEEDLKRRDMKIILELDQKVMEQQVTLEKAGVPGFHVTNNEADIRLQMYLLDFMLRLSQLRTDAVV